MFGKGLRSLGGLIRLTLILLMGIACLAVCANPTFARGPAVRVQTGRANVVVNQRGFRPAQVTIAPSAFRVPAANFHVQQFRQQPVIVQQQLGFGGYGGVQAIVQPQCVGGSCGQLLLVR